MSFLGGQDISFIDADPRCGVLSGNVTVTVPLEADVAMLPLAAAELPSKLTVEVENTR